jgi:hypothetical protein
MGADFFRVEPNGGAGRVFAQESSLHYSRPRSRVAEIQRVDADSTILLRSHKRTSMMATLGPLYKAELFQIP